MLRGKEDQDAAPISFPNLLVLIIVGLALFYGVTALFQWLWNITMPDVFNLKKLITGRPFVYC